MMKLLNNHNYSSFLVFFFIICFIFTQFTLFEFLIPLISESKFSNLGLFSGDAEFFHLSALKYKNYLVYDKYIDHHLGMNYGLFSKNFFDLSSIPLNIKILSLFYYTISEDPLVLILLNGIYFTISILCLHNISHAIMKIPSHHNILFLFLGLILTFFPSIVHSFNSSGKEAMTICFLLIYLNFFFKVINIKNFYINFQNIIIMFIAFICLFFIRNYVFFALFFFTFFYILVLLFHFKKNSADIIQLFYICFIFLISFYIGNLIQSYSINYSSNNPILRIHEYILYQNKIHNELYNFKMIYLSYIPDFIENIYEKLVLLRLHFINFSLSQESQNIISINILPNNIVDFLLFLPRLIFESLFSPYPFNYKSNSSSNLFILISYLEMIFNYILYLSLLIKFKYVRLHEFYLIFFVIFITSLLLFINPNIGTFYRVKTPYNLILLILSFKYWVLILKDIYFFIKNETFIQSYLNYKTLLSKKIIQVSSINLLCLFMLTILVICREYFFIANIGLKNDLSHYLFTIGFISIISSSINTPLTDTFLTFKNYNKNSLNGDNYYLLLFLIFIVFLVAIFFSLFTNEFYSIFNLNFSYNFSLSLFVFIVLLSIPINSFLSTFLFNNNKSVIVYLSQLIVPIISILFCFVYSKEITIDLIYLSITLGIISNTTILVFYSFINNFNFKFLLNFNLFYFKNIFKNSEFFRLLIIIINLFVINSIILVAIYYVSQINYNFFLHINIAFRGTLIINAIISAIVTAIILPIIIKNKNLSKDFIKLIFIFSIILCTSMSLIFLILNNFFSILYNNNSTIIEIIDVIKDVICLLPLSVLISLLFKYFIIMGETKKFLFLSLFFVSIFCTILLIYNDISITILINIIAMIYFFILVSSIYFLNSEINFKLPLIILSFICLLLNYINSLYFIMILIFSLFFIYLISSRYKVLPN